MAITSLDLNGNPWIVCDPNDQAEIVTFVGNSGVDPADVTQRAPTPRDVAKITAERVFRQSAGEDFDGFFGVSL